MTMPDDKRAALYGKLEEYARMHPEQAGYACRIMQFVEEAPDCFARTHTAGHITGSAWLLNSNGSKALLTLHRKLGKWLQLGGHADGDADTLRVALREAEEESGISGIVAVHPQIFDVDIHRIPAHSATEAAHWHYDIRYLLRAPHERFRISSESRALRWFTQGELLSSSFSLDGSVRRLAKKAAQYNEHMQRRK